MDSSLVEKRIVITGALGVLGRQLVEALAKEGAVVIALDISATGIDEFEQYENVTYVSCDISTEQSVIAAIHTLTSLAGGCDVLINNAATKSSCLQSFFAPIEDYSLETWREVMSVNIDGMFLMLKHILPLMRKQKAGNIIQVSSVYGLVGPDSRIYLGSEYLGQLINTPAVYSASKAAVLGLTKWVATEYGHLGIRANSIIPGGVASGQNQQFEDNYSNRVPMRRMADISEIISAIVFLASDESSYVNGHSLCVDGGLTAW